MEDLEELFERELWETEMKKKVKEMEEQDMKNAELQEELEDEFIKSIRKESIDD